MQHARTSATRVDARYFVTVAAVSIAYFGAAKFGLSLAFATKQVTAVWPPTGVAVAALILFGTRMWPAVFVGAFFANASADAPLTTAAGIAVGNALGPLVAAILLQRLIRFDKAVARLRDVFALVLLGGVLSMTITATNGVANLAIAGIIPWSAYASVWWVWWVGDTLGVVLLTPFLLTWAAEPRIGWTGARLVELGILFLGLLSVGYFVFAGAYQLQYLVFPFIIWAALRFGQRETTSVVLAISAMAIWGAIHDRGPFAAGTLDERLVLLDIFMAVTALTGFALGAVRSERHRAETSLLRAHAELETRVRDRTAELASANQDLKQVNQALGVRTDELAAKNEEVEAFVYIVSHDLRAPLVNLQGFSKELEHSCAELERTLRGVLPAASEATIQMILRDGVAGSLKYISASTTKFQRLIDALLLLSRTGKQEFARERVDVKAVVESTVLSLHGSIQTAGAELTVEPMPAAVGDVTALGQVFSNLISNALKYLQPGRPGRICVGGELRDGSAHYWVRDNGAGIPTSSQRRLFQVFQRFHPDLAPGEGMGLAIVKRLVERHGGRVWAESEEGVGTTFHVTLDRAAED